MTNNEILRASLLDIIFENRNKEYGAYALRRNYNHRLLTALGGTLSFILLFILINGSGKNEVPVVSSAGYNDSIAIRVVEVPREPEKLSGTIKPKQVEKVTAIRNSSTIVIKQDILVTNLPPENSDLDGKKPGAENVQGSDIGLAGNEKAVTAGNGNLETSKPAETFIPDERDPEFPGGPQALKRFLAVNLLTPGDLDAGEKKMVQIRFMVDKEGNVFVQEIVSSGGNEFDREVIRVCKKMPRWKPAVQNGANVSVSYILPVTFIGAEQ
jgi:periplasmic protein TonB